VRPSSRKFADGLKKLLHQRRRETERRLVEHNEFGLPHQAAADRQHLLLAARHRTRDLLAALGEPRKQRINALDFVVHFGARARQERAHLQIFLHGQRRENLTAFRDLTNAEIADDDSSAYR
jgi:hypothetical protein